MELREEFGYLLWDHDNCIWESPSHTCFCHLSPPCLNCVECPSGIEEAWVERD